MNYKYLLKAASLSVFALALIAGAPAYAQQTETQALRTQIEELQKRLDAIEAAQAAQASSSTPNPLTTKEKVILSGLLQVHGLGFPSEDVRTGGTRGTDTFRLRRGELRLTAPAITSRISGTIQIDPAKSVSGRSNIQNGQNINIRARDNVLQEIAISYLLKQNAAKTTTATVDVGQYKIPFGYEGDRVSSAALTFVERALLFTQRDTQDGGYGDVRDTGVQIKGTLGGQFDYNLGVFNGLGELQNTTAVSDQKAFIGRLIYRPSGLQGLQIGASAATANSATPTSSTRLDRDMYNGFVVYKKDKIGLQAEYLSGESQVRGAANTSKVRGYYGSLSYLFTPKLEGAFRYDYFDANRSLAQSDVEDYTLGLNYYIKGNNAKIQANIVQRNGSANAPAGLRNDRTELRTNFQISF